MLFGLGSGDDAGVYRLRDDLAIVQTVDFFTPIVDDPFDFGAVAAANALSDCYALGATPITGLNLVCFPCSIGIKVLQEVLRGGEAKLEKAGATVIGGHSVNDPEPKFGVAVTGIIDPRTLITNQGAKQGDALVITKKIGIGIITNFRKPRSTLGEIWKTMGIGGGHISDATFEEALTSMKTLNKVASRLMVEFGAHACTDITGFGLLGHAFNMASASNVALEISYDKVPKFPEVELYAIQGTKGGNAKNKASVRDKVQLAGEIGEVEYSVLCDAQTSGPLFIAVDPRRADEFVSALHLADVPQACIIGSVQEDHQGGIIRVVP